MERKHKLEFDDILNNDLEFIKSGSDFDLTKATLTSQPVSLLSIFKRGSAPTISSLDSI